MGQPGEININCGHFRLRPLQPSDRQNLARHANNRNIWRNVRDIFPSPYTLRDADDYISFCQRQQHLTYFCIAVQNECAGMIGYTQQSDVYRLSAEIGYWLGEAFWGHEIMTTAVRTLTAHIFSTTDIVRLFAGIFEWNPASRRVLEKAGFKQDGLFEKSIYKDGQLVNEYRYSLLKPGLK